MRLTVNDLGQVQLTEAVDICASCGERHDDPIIRVGASQVAGRFSHLATHIVMTTPAWGSA